MSEKFQRGSIVVNKGAEEHDSKIVILVTGDRSKSDNHFSGVCIRTYNHRITPIGDFSDTWHLSKFEKLFDSFEEWLTTNQQKQLAGREEDFTEADADFLRDCDLYPTFNGLTVITENDEGASIDIDDITKLAVILKRYVTTFK